MSGESEHEDPLTIRLKLQEQTLLAAIGGVRSVVDRVADDVKRAADAAEKASKRAQDNSERLAKMNGELPGLRKDVDRNQGDIEKLSDRVDGMKRSAQVSGGVSGAVVTGILGAIELVLKRLGV